MKLFRTVKEVKEHRAGLRSVGLVPTMGAFHEGHLELMRQARAHCETVYVSLFVNPAQFSEDDDLASYPRNEQRDLELAESQGVDAVFAPPVEEVYPGNAKKIFVKGVSELWEGEHRTGHFDGVATAVYRLFDIFEPDQAFFGLKDLQQCAVITKMVADNNLAVQIVTVETVREESGLALSSRNFHFEPEDLANASFLYKTLTSAARSISEADKSFAEISNLAKSDLQSAGFVVDYFAIVDDETMVETNSHIRKMRIICAANFKGVRLIDNVQCL